MNNRLSVQISLNGLSFLVSDQFKKEVFYKEVHFTETKTPEELLEELEITFENTTRLSEKFINVSVAYDTPLYTLVPATIFDENKASDYLKFNSKILATDFIANESFNNDEIVTVYVPFVNINNFFFDQFGSFNYYHSITLFTEKILNIEKGNDNKKIYLQVSDAMFHLVAVSNGQLKLCNTYTYKTAEDFCYYALFTIEQLRYNPDKIEVILSGKIDLESELYKLLFTYIRNISFLNSDVSKISTEAETHYNVILKAIE